MSEKEGDTQIQLSPEMQKLKTLFIEIFSSRVACNEWLIDPLFHHLIGVFINYYAPKLYLSRSAYYPAKTHVFIIQHSGTGKSEAMEVCFQILKQLFQKRPCRNWNGVEKQDEENVMQLTTVTDAGLLGTVNMNRMGIPVVREGSLSYCDAIYWNEASVLLKGSKFNENTMDILQMACDGKSWVEKQLANGNIKFMAKSSVVATSYWVDKFNDVLFQRGLFQRFFLCCKQLTPKDQVSIIDEINRVNERAMKPWVVNEKIAEMDKILSSFIHRLDNIRENPQKLCISESASLAYRKKTKELLSKIEHEYSDATQSILYTFVSRLSAVIYPLAAQTAILCKKEEIDGDCVDYAFSVAKTHIEGFLLLSSKLKKQVDDVDELRKHIVLKAHLNLDQTNRGVNKGSLVSEICSGRYPKWNLGIHGTEKYVVYLVTELSPPILTLEIIAGENNSHKIKRRPKNE